MRNAPGTAGFRQRAVVDPTDGHALVAAVWPPATRLDLVRCARHIKYVMVLLASGVRPGPDAIAFITHVRERIRRSIEFLQQRDRRLATAKTWSVRTARGREVRFPLADGAARLFKEIAEGYDGGFEHALHDFLLDNLGPGDVFVDVGAHIGYASAFAATTGATVFAVEVQRELIPLIEQMASLNGFDQLYVLHAAASSGSGLTRIQRVAPHPGFQLAGAGVPGLDSDAVSVTADFVPILSLDSAFGSHELTPRVVKIDVEGHEIDVLQGSRRLIGLGRATFVVEVHPHLLESFGHSVGELTGLFPFERWSWFQLTDTALRPISAVDQIEPDPNDPNPKLVFQPCGPAATR